MNRYHLPLLLILTLAACSRDVQSDYTYINMMKDLNVPTGTDVAVVLYGYQCFSCKEELDALVDSLHGSKKVVYITSDNTERDALVETGKVVFFDKDRLSSKVVNARPVTTVVFFNAGQEHSRLPLDANNIERILSNLRTGL